jgi:hypothetical protein
VRVATRESKDLRDPFSKQLDKIGSPAKDGIVELLGGLKQQTVKTKWVTAEIDRITTLAYFIITISVFIYAILLIPDLLPKIAQPFRDVESTRLAIFIFSFIALVAVVIMFIIRIRGLQTKALTVLMYLTALGIIKTDKEGKENVKTTFKDIERYLDDNHWTLAEYWVRRLQEEYSELFLEAVKKPTRVPR